MWKNITKLLPLSKQSISTSESCLIQQYRTVYTVKRQNQPFYHKKGSLPKKLKYKHYIYDTVNNSNSHVQPPIEVILTKYIPGLGNVGDKVSVKHTYGYNHLLLTGRAVYPSPEYIEKYKNYERKVDDVVYSSATVQYTIAKLTRFCLSVVMNQENAWTLKPWHIKASFRKSGYEVPEDAITMPMKEIKGPNMDIENKEFFITVTINNTEQVKVRCRIHHWSTAATEKLPYVPKFHRKKAEAIFPEDAPILDLMPRKYDENDEEED